MGSLELFVKEPITFLIKAGDQMSRDAHRVNLLDLSVFAKIQQNFKNSVYLTLRELVPESAEFLNFLLLGLAVHASVITILNNIVISIVVAENLHR